MSEGPLGASLHKVDCGALNTLVHQYDQALDENFGKKAQFNKYKEDYIKLRARLKTLPDKLEYEAMVPLCSKAVCPGKLIHTNELLVLLGENTFAEVSAKKAAEIVTHRLKKIEDTLNRLDKETELYNSWKLEAERQMVETLGEGTIEIMEEYEEAKESEWRAAHRDSLRRYHEGLAAERAAAKEQEQGLSLNNQGRTVEEERLWTRLDALELEEEFMEAQALYEERRSVEPSITATKCTARIREKKGAAPPAPSLTSSKKVTFNPEKIIHKLEDLKKGRRRGPATGQGHPSSLDPEQVQLYKSTELSNSMGGGGEEGLHDPIFIRFRHESPGSASESPLVSSSPVESASEEEYQIVSSPGDIYETFGPWENMGEVPGAGKTPQKSILKKKRSPPPYRTPTPYSPSLAPEDEEVLLSPPNKTREQEEVLASRVAERHTQEQELQGGVGLSINLSKEGGGGGRFSSSSKPLSLFKKMRMKEEDVGGS